MTDLRTAYQNGIEAFCTNAGEQYADNLSLKARIAFPTTWNLVEKYIHNPAHVSEFCRITYWPGQPLAAMINSLDGRETILVLASTLIPECATGGRYETIDPDLGTAYFGETAEEVMSALGIDPADGDDENSVVAFSLVRQGSDWAPALPVAEPPARLRA